MDTVRQSTGDQMDERDWIRLLPWRQKNKANSKSAQIKFAPKLEITHDSGWVYLELQLVNRSSWAVWVEKATVVLIDLDAESQTEISTGEAELKISHNIRPNDELRVSLARAIYDAAGKPQGPYSCFVLTNVVYRALDEWCNVQLDEVYRIEVEALNVIGLRRAHRDNRKIKQINGLVDLTINEHKR
jgi:hypothetical protein